MSTTTPPRDSSPSVRRTAPDWLYDTLRERIIRGELEPGAALRQQHLAAEFGMSAIPVREALRMLEASRLVTIAPNRGAVVRTMSLVDALEIVDIRIALEPLAISMAVPNMDEQSLTGAAEILERYATTEDPFESSLVNRDFHFALYERCGSSRLLRMVESLFDDVLRLAHINISLKKGNQQAYREHGRIWSACRQRKPELAADRVRAHIERSRKTLTKLMREG